MSVAKRECPSCVAVVWLNAVRVPDEITKSLVVDTYRHVSLLKRWAEEASEREREYGAWKMIRHKGACTKQHRRKRKKRKERIVEWHRRSFATTTTTSWKLQSKLMLWKWTSHLGVVKFEIFNGLFLRNKKSCVSTLIKFPWQFIVEFFSFFALYGKRRVKHTDFSIVKKRITLNWKILHFHIFTLI